MKNRLLKYFGITFIAAIAAATVIAAAGAAAAGTYRLRVDGLACPFCAYGIEKKLSAVHGVAKVEIDIARGRVTVITHEPVTLAEETAREAVRRAGFTLRGFSVVTADR